MITSSQSATSRAQLVAALQQMGAIHSVAVADAFSAVPRERFVSQFYQQEARTWIPYSEETHGEQWLALIYRDEALVTLLDAQNIPLSSSSMPSIMATMLEALDVQPGMEILEIGTGTGYNAGLLAKLTGEPSLVTTIEIDEELAQRAEQILHTCVGPIHVLRGDGGMDTQPFQQYHRIIATASVSGVPRAWYARLAPGGRLVMPLQGSLNASGLLVIEKAFNDANHASGTFLPVPLSFMSMRSTSVSSEPTARELFQMPVQEHIRVEGSNLALIEALQGQDFRWFLEWSWPKEGTLQMARMTLHDGRQALVLKDPRQGAIVQLNREAADCWSGQLRGTFPLCQHILHFYHVYEELGYPSKEAFRVCLDRQQAYLVVRFGEKQVTLRDLFV